MQNLLLIWELGESTSYCFGQRYCLNMPTYHAWILLGKNIVYKIKKRMLVSTWIADLHRDYQVALINTWQSQVENKHYSVSMKVVFSASIYALGHCLGSS